MLKGWVELFDRFIESVAKNYDERETAILDIARHACGMVILLLVVIIVICFQSVMQYMDYSVLKQDYTELNVSYLKHSDVFFQVNDRLGGLEKISAELRATNSELVDKVDNLYTENSTLQRDLFLCRNPQAKPASH